MSITLDVIKINTIKLRCNCGLHKLVRVVPPPPDSVGFHLAAKSIILYELI